MSLPRQNSQLVDADGRPTREFYTWMRGLMAQTAEAEARAPAVGDLSDVVISSLTDGDTLIYDNSIGRWVNGAGGGGGGYDEGTSFPGSPATGDKFYRTDLNWLCFYDGTRWLTVHEYCDSFGMQDRVLPLSISANVGWIPSRRDRQMYITRLIAHGIVQTTNNGSNYWSLEFGWANQANTRTVLSTPTTSAIAANNNFDISVAVNAPLDSTSYRIDVTAVKTGAPGSLYPWCAVAYRLIVT